MFKSRATVSLITSLLLATITTPVLGLEPEGKLLIASNEITLRRSSLFLKRDTQEPFEVKVVEGYPLAINFAPLGEIPRHVQIQGKRYFHYTQLGTTLSIELHQPIEFPGTIDPGYKQGFMTVVCASGAIFQMSLRATERNGDSLIDLYYETEEPQRPLPVETAQSFDIPVPLPTVTETVVPPPGELPLLTGLEPLGDPPAPEDAEDQEDSEPAVVVAQNEASVPPQRTQEPEQAATLDQLQKQIEALDQQIRQQQKQQRQGKKVAAKEAREQAKVQKQQEKRQEKEARRLAQQEAKQAKRRQKQEKRRQALAKRLERLQAEQLALETQQAAAITEETQTPTPEPTPPPGTTEITQANAPEIRPTNLTGYKPVQLAHYLVRGANQARVLKEIQYSKRRGSAWWRVQKAVGLLKRGMKWDKAVAIANLNPKFANDLLAYGLPQNQQ